MKFTSILAFCFLMISHVLAADERPINAILDTNAGPIIIELNWEKDPEATTFFYQALKAGIYENNYFFTINEHNFLHNGIFDRPDKYNLASGANLFRPLPYEVKASEVRKYDVVMRFGPQFQDNNYISFSINNMTNERSPEDGERVVGRVRGQVARFTLNNILKNTEDGKLTHKILTQEAYFYSTEEEKTALLGTVPRPFKEIQLPTQLKENILQNNYTVAILAGIFFINFLIYKNQSRYFSKTEKILSMLSCALIIVVLFFAFYISWQRDLAILLATTSFFKYLGTLKV